MSARLFIFADKQLNCLLASSCETLGFINSYSMLSLWFAQVSIHVSPWHRKYVYVDLCWFLTLTTISFKLCYINTRMFVIAPIKHASNAERLGARQLDADKLGACT